MYSPKAIFWRICFFNIFIPMKNISHDPPRFKYLIISVLCFCLGVLTVEKAYSSSRKTKMDSLLVRLEQEQNDTTKLVLLEQVCDMARQQNLYVVQMDYALKLLELAEKLNNPNYTSEAYNNIGLVYRYREDYSSALKNYYKALAIAEKEKNIYAISVFNTNIGVILAFQNNDSLALVYYLKALAILPHKEIPDKVNLYINIGAIYKRQKQYSKAIEYHTRAWEITKKHFGSKSLEGIRYYTGIGDVYCEKAEYDSAKIYYMELYKIIGDDFRLIKPRVDFFHRMGLLHLKTSKEQEAIQYLNKALHLADSIGYNRAKILTLFALSDAYEQANQIPPALECYKKAMTLKDSLRNDSKIYEISRMEAAYEFEAQKKQLEEQQKEKQKSKATTVWIFASLFILMVAFLGVAFLFLFIIRKQKKTVESQKQELEEQKKIIEEKNKDVMDSIHYAERIQMALLREEEHVSTHLPEHFILFMPKDIVSGDFYWANEKQDYFYFAVVDCTGHGVPGAIMSMLGISFLNDIVLMCDLPSPAYILDKLRERIVSELRQNDETIANRDGMDISLCRLNLKTLELQWAGANNPLCLLRKSSELNPKTKTENYEPRTTDYKLFEIKADKQPIGYYPNPKPFTNHVVQLQKGDCIYLYSDGYADQFGGPKGKKLNYKRLEALFTGQHISMSEQKEKLKNYFVEWKGTLEQIDDVCVVGVRV